MGIGGFRPYLLGILGASCLFAADVQRFVVSQARPQLPVMTAYLDIVDAGGQPVADLTPANFTAALGANSAQVTAIRPFLETGEGVGYVFLVDISGSIGGADFDQIRGAIQTWIAGLKPLDRAAIATFGDDYHLVADFTGDKDKLSTALNALASHDGHTLLYKAIDQALELAQRVDEGLPARRVMVLLSDGKDEGSALAPDDVILKIRTSRLPIYTIGVSHLPRAQRQRYLDILHRFSNASGGLYTEAAGDTVPALYAAIQQAILRVFVAGVACQGCPADGRSYPLEMTVTQGSRGLKAESFDVIPLPAPPSSPPAQLPATRAFPLWVWIAAGLVAVAGVGGLLLRRGGAEEPDPIPRERAVGAVAVSKSVPGPGGETTTSTTEDEETAVGGMPMKLAIVIGKEAGSAHELRLEKTAIIGRATDCDVVVPDPQVSNHHCELALLHGKLVVYDLNSTNATYVNGVPIIGRHRLEPLDTILVGDTELRVHFEEK
jgi:Mg-chelatase subunit ChlD